MGIAAILVGLVLVGVAIVGRGDSSGDSVTASSTTITGGTTKPGAPVAGTTVPLRPGGGIGEGVARTPSGRRALRGFSEATATITSGSGETCEVCLMAATTPEQQERGLMEVTDATLGGYDGMVFAYRPPVNGAFWMRNTPLPLSIAYFDAGGSLLAALDMAPCADSPDCPDYPAGSPFAYALEVPKGGLPGLAVTGKARIEVRFEDCPLARADHATTTGPATRPTVPPD